MNFTATRVPSVAWIPSQTEPIPPRPSMRVSRYLPATMAAGTTAVGLSESTWVNAYQDIPSSGASASSETAVFVVRVGPQLVRKKRHACTKTHTEARGFSCVTEDCHVSLGPQSRCRWAPAPSIPTMSSESNKMRPYPSNDCAAYTLGWYERAHGYGALPRRVVGRRLPRRPLE